MEPAAVVVAAAKVAARAVAEVAARAVAVVWVAPDSASVPNAATKLRTRPDPHVSNNVARAVAGPWSARARLTIRRSRVAGPTERLNPEHTRITRRSLQTGTERRVRSCREETEPDR